MGKCSKCACRVLAGAEHLPPPNWKEKKQLGERLEQGYRLICQLWIEHDIELAQDELAPAEEATGAAGRVPAGVKACSSPT
jgi:ferredoxin